MKAIDIIIKWVKIDILAVLAGVCYHMSCGERFSYLFIFVMVVILDWFYDNVTVKTNKLY